MYKANAAIFSEIPTKHSKHSEHNVEFFSVEHNIEFFNVKPGGT
jgi:hypothetical protein